MQFWQGYRIISPMNQGRMMIVVHARGRHGFIPGALLPHKQHSVLCIPQIGESEAYFKYWPAKCHCDGKCFLSQHKSRQLPSFRHPKGCYTGIYEPRHEVSNNVVCATSKASDQPEHMRSLIRAFARRLNSL